MTIDRLKGNNYNPGKTEKSDSSTKSSGAEKSTGASGVSSGSGTKKAAHISLSGSKFDSELAFTKKVFSNARQESFASLKKIKQKINAGAYNSEAVHKEISSAVKNDLSSLQALFPPTSRSKSSQPVVTAEQKRNLLENPEVTKKVADKIADQLKNL